MRARWLCAAVLCATGSARADGIIDVAPDPVPPFSTVDTLFPNWLMTPTSSFALAQCDDAVCLTPDCEISGMTLMNYGTATGGAAGDIRAMYFHVQCGSKTAVGPIAMTFAGNWTVPIYGSLPVWTWGGNVPWGGDPCGNLGFSCLCNPSLMIYTDISPCPTNGATVKLGPGFNDVRNPAWPGGITDSCGYAAPYGPVTDPAVKFLRYVSKTADKDIAAPGDTINYTIFYGRPGTAALTNIVVMDTMPAYTHLVSGSAIPAPDPGWDPDPGPPTRLRWTIPPPLPVTGGPTGMVRFALSVDWGNGEGFEPGSGDLGAPEGMRLENRAAADFPGTTCATKAVVTAPTQTVVSRFRFWKVGSNDILYSPSIGQPPDEMTYEIFVRNLSSTKTWWDARVWDTVPPELDSWCVGCGFEDPCLGWTMTPSGCAAATPGRVTAGGVTLLTWKLDMPPDATLALRWRAQVKASDTAGMTALNRVSIMSFGKTGIVGGTGGSGAPRTFTHQAPIVLPTIYVSYLAMAAGANSYFVCCNDVLPFGDNTYYLVFFPLNMKTNFSIYEQYHINDVYAQTGGLSPSITAPGGGCFGGPGWIPGCAAERAPAWYLPPLYAACASTVPLHNFYKLVANSPLIWELDSADIHSGAEVSTWVGTTSLTYNGYSSYVYARTCNSATNRDGLYVVNSSSTLPTTIHVFDWDGATKAWSYRTTAEVDIESVWFYYPPVQNAYRIISSDTQFMLFKALPFTGNANTNSMMPSRENGFLSNSAPSTFYGFAESDAPQGGAIIVTNLGAGTATYNIHKYTSWNPGLPITSTKHQNPNLVGSSGFWVNRLTGETVPPLYTAALNPHAYQQGYTGGASDERSMYKVTLTSGGPIQIYSGYRLNDSFGGGAVFHSDSKTPAGTVYWYSLTELGGSGKICPSPFYGTMTVDVFVPKATVAVQAVNEVGYTARYTTTGSDQVVAFMALTPPNAPDAYNWRINSIGGNIAVAQYQICSLHQKLFSAPFVAQGVHYNFIAPPVVYVGQSFWMTVIVVEVAGDTKDDYCGTTSFTSTDPGAKIEGTAMDTYNYTWSSSVAPCNAGSVNGVRVFVNVTMTRLGLQTIVGTDTTDGSIVGITAVNVVGADVKFTKEPRLTVAASQDTVQFRVCWSNYSSASAFVFTMTDAVPRDTTFLPEAGTWAFWCGSTDNVPVVTSYSTATTPTVPAAASWITANPVAGTRWLRWTIPMAGVQTTGCACFRVTVN